MTRRGTLVGALMLFMGAVCLPASAQYQRAFGWCEQGGHSVKTNGVQSTTFVQQSYKACTVTVFLTGTTTLATIFNDSAHTLPLANPFTATSTGFWAFYAADGTYDTQFSNAGITSPFSIAGWKLGSSGGGGGGGGGSGTVGPGTTNRLSKFTSATSVGNSVCSDDGINPTTCPGFSLSTNALFFVKPNNVSTGTTANLLVARDGTASQSVQNAQTTDTDNVIGIAGFGAGTSGSVSVAFSGQFPCTFDNQTAVGDWIILGSGSQCHDVGASQPAGIETVGRVNSVNSGAGTLAGVDLGMPDVTSTSTGGGTGVVSTVVCTGPLGTYTAPGNTITGDCNTSDDGAGNLSATSYTATGASAGFFASQQGAAPTLSTANANYFYADTSVVNTFGTAWPTAPGTLGQALTVAAVPDATHIKLGYSNAGCAEGTCVINAPTADQTIAGAHSLILSNAGSGLTSRGTQTFGPASTGDVSIDDYFGPSKYTARQAIDGSTIFNGAQFLSKSTAQSVPFGIIDEYAPTANVAIVKDALDVQAYATGTHGTSGALAGVIGTVYQGGSGTYAVMAGFYSAGAFNFGGSQAPVINAGFYGGGLGVYGTSVNAPFYCGDQGTNALSYCIYDAGTLTKSKLGALSVNTLGTVANCAGVGTAANPSVVTCVAASAGAFSCATAASTGTCQVNTTAVTANSEIFVTQVVDEGTRLSVTCNTGSVLPAGPLVTAKSAGASFTITLGTVAVNPGCFDFYIVN